MAHIVANVSLIDAYVHTADSVDSLAVDASLMTFSSGRSLPLERIYTTRPPIAYRGDGQPSVPDGAPTIWAGT